MMKPSLMIASLCQHLSKGARAHQDIGAHIVNEADRRNWTLLIFFPILYCDGDDYRLRRSGRVQRQRETSFGTVQTGTLN